MAEREVLNSNILQGKARYHGVAEIARRDACPATDEWDQTSEPHPLQLDHFAHRSQATEAESQRAVGREQPEPPLGSACLPPQFSFRPSILQQIGVA